MSSVFRFKDCILNAGMERLHSKHFLYSTVMHESIKLWTCKNKMITQGTTEKRYHSYKNIKQTFCCIQKRAIRKCKNFGKSNTKQKAIYFQIARL